MRKLWILVILLFSGNLFAVTRNITTFADFTTAIGAANPGDVLLVDDGVSIAVTSSQVISRNGTSGSHITLKCAGYRASTFVMQSGTLIRLSANYWDISNLVFDGYDGSGSARSDYSPSNESPLTIGWDDGRTEVHDVTTTGVKVIRSGAAGWKLGDRTYNITVNDSLVDGTGYNSLHGECIYLGSVADAYGYHDITFNDLYCNDNTENILDSHPNVQNKPTGNVVYNRVYGSNMVSCVEHWGCTSSIPYQTIIATTGTINGGVFLNNKGANFIWSGSATGNTLNVNNLYANKLTLTSSLLQPTGETLNIDSSQIWNSNSSVVTQGAGTITITNTCGTNKSGTGNSLTCSTPSTPTYWQSTIPAVNTGTSVSKIYPIPVVAGSLLAVSAVTTSDVSATFSASDDVNGAWTAGYNSGGKLNFFYKMNSAAGTITPTFTAGASTTIRAQFFEFRGVDASTVLASSNSGSGTGATQGSGNVTTGQDNNLLVQTCTADSAVTLTKDSNFTLRGFNGGDTLLTATRVPATGTYASTCTQSGSATIRSGIANFGPPTATGTIEVGSVQNLEDGATFTISWSSLGLSENVDIFISRDGGTTWEELVDNTADDGAYDWTVAGGSGSSCQFKVGGHTSTTVYGVSNTFRKKGKYL